MERVFRQSVAKGCSQPASLQERGKEIPISISFSSSSCQQSPLAKPNQNSCCGKPFMLPVSTSFWAGSRMEKGGISLWVRGKSYSSPRKFTFLCSARFQASSPLSPHNLSTPTPNFTSLSTWKPSKKNIVISNFTNFSAARSKFLSYRIKSVPLALSKASMYALNLDPSFSHKLHFF